MSRQFPPRGSRHKLGGRGYGGSEGSAGSIFGSSGDECGSGRHVQFRNKMPNGTSQPPFGNAHQAHKKQLEASQFQRTVSEVGLHDLFRSICFDILVQRPEDPFKYTVERLREEAKRRRKPQPPANDHPRVRSSPHRSANSPKMNSPRVQRLRRKNRHGCLDPKTLVNNFKESYRFTCNEAIRIFDAFGGRHSRTKTVRKKVFIEVVRENSSYTHGRIISSNAERLFSLFLWAQPVHPGGTINVFEACSVIASLSDEPGIERLRTLLYFAAPNLHSDNTFKKEHVFDAIMCYMCSSQLVVCALAMRAFKVKTKSSNRMEACYRMDATLMGRRVKAFVEKIWNSEHRKFRRLHLLNIYSQLTSGDAWGEVWPEHWTIYKKRLNASEEAVPTISDDELLSQWAVHLLHPNETKSVGAEKERIRPLPEPLVKCAVERAYMSQEELAMKRYIAKLKWVEEEKKRALEREAQERQRQERERKRLLEEARIRKEREEKRLKQKEEAEIARKKLEEKRRKEREEAEQRQKDRAKQIRKEVEEKLNREREGKMRRKIEEKLRKKMEDELQKEIEEKLRREKESHHAATKIQSRVRGRQASKRVDKAREQREAARREREAALKEQREAAVKIQACERGRRERRLAKERNDRRKREEETEAATKIQAIHRGRSGRNHAQKVRADHHHRHHHRHKHKKKHHAENEKSRQDLDDFMEHIWYKYDADMSGGIDSEETKQMIEDITGGDVSSEQCEQFLNQINSGTDDTISREELTKFIHAGIHMNDEMREEYSTRGELHKTIVEFFVGIDEARLKFKKDAETIKHKRELDAFLAHIWTRYDTDNSGGIDSDETKQMIEDITGHNVSSTKCKQFLRHIDSDGDNVIQREELLKFIFAGINLSEEGKEKYASRGDLHNTIIEFFNGVNKKRAEFGGEQTQAANKIQAIHRGRRGRQEAQRIKLEQEQERKEQTEAATRLQSVSRGRAERQRHKDRLKQKEGREREAAATKIQSIHRGRSARKSPDARPEPEQDHMQQKEEREREAAATRLQSVSRGRAERQRHKDRLKQKEGREREAAATKIQSIHRGRSARKSPNASPESGTKKGEEGEAPKKKKKKKPKVKPLPISKTLDNIAGIYEKKVKADAVDDAKDNDRDSLPEFLQDFFLQMYGMKSMARKKKAQFKAGVMHNIDDNSRCKWFAALTNWLPEDAFGEQTIPYRKNAIDAYLFVMQRVFPPASIEELLDDDPCLINEAVCIEAIEALFSNQLQHLEVISLINKLRDSASGKKGEKVLTFDDAFDSLMRAWYKLELEKD